jgi:ABC-2 type transport system permease protein
MRIFFRELKANLKSLLIWCGINTLFIFLVCAKYSAFAKDPSLLVIIKSMPKALVDVLNMRTFNLTTLNGFYGLMFLYLALMGGIAAAMWSSDSVSREERDKTVEFSLVLPVSRSKVITAKLLTSLVNCVVFVLVSWGASLVAVRQFNPDPAFYNFLTLEMEGMFVIELVFLAIGFLLGCAMKQYKRSGSTAVAVILVTYFLSIISTMQPKLDFLKYLTPFRYFDAGELFRSGAMNGTYLVLSAAIIAVCVGTAYWVYNKRDLYI